MKKILGIVVLGLLLSILNLNESVEANTLKINSKQRISTKGDVFYKWPHKWKFSYAMDYWSPEKIQEISYNTRLGKSALRFEVKPGSCGKTSGGSDDCKNGKHGSERHELLPDNRDRDITLNGNTWIAISFFIEEFKDMDGHNSVVQFHSDGDWAPMFNWSMEDGLKVQRRTACNVPKIYKSYAGKGNKYCTAYTEKNHVQTVLPLSELFNKWNDIVFNINFTTKETGFLKMWINGNIVYHYQGPIKPPDEGGNWSNNSTMQFGIYRSHDYGKWQHTQVHYYDEIRYSKKKCSKLKLEDLGYNCKSLETQKITIDTIDN